MTATLAPERANGKHGHKKATKTTAGAQGRNGNEAGSRTALDMSPTATSPNAPADLNLAQPAGMLEVGEGEYVAPVPTMYSTDDYQTNEKGERVLKTRWWNALQFRDVALPVKFMKPRLLDATQAAMAGRVFDELCTVDGPRGRKKSDPLIIGRILGPKDRMLSFLVGWFIDTRDL